MLYILTFQVLSMFYLLNFLFCPGFLTFRVKFQAICGLGQIKFKFPGFQVPLETLLYTYHTLVTDPASHIALTPALSAQLVAAMVTHCTEGVTHTR